MKTIQDIYSKYRIMPTLQEHQLRVAAVAQQVCDSLSVAVNTELVVSTCLLHDMGNIIKFDLSYFPEFLQPEGLEYWQGVKDDYVATYGLSEHAATEQIFMELGRSDLEVSYLNGIGFSRAEETLQNGSLEHKICCYADQRIGPKGVLSLAGRFAEGRARYAARTDRPHFSNDRFEKSVSAIESMEKEIFSHSSILPEQVSDDSVADRIENLKACEI